MLAWKRKSDKAFVNSGQYNIGEMSLPSQPPPGKEWRKTDTGEWELFDKEANPQQETEKSTEDPSEDESAELLHKVNRNIDTLEGLCLRYKTNRRTLQNLNNFSGSSLAMAPDVLKIPRQKGVNVDRRSSKEAIEAMERANILKKFITLFPSLSQMEGRIYLDDTNYDFESAAKAARADMEWEESDKGTRAERRNSKFNNNADQAERFVRGVKEGEEDQVGKGHIKMVAVAMEEKVE